MISRLDEERKKASVNSNVSNRDSENNATRGKRVGGKINRGARDGEIVL